MMRFLFVVFAMCLMLSSCETTGPETASTGSAPAEVANDSPSKPAPAGPKPYPRKTCLVTGEKLDARGTPMTFVHQGQEIKVCCVACEMAFKMSPKTYMDKL